MPIPTRNLPVGAISSFSGSAPAGTANIIDAPRTRPAIRGKDRSDIAYFLPWVPYESSSFLLVLDLRNRLSQTNGKFVRRLERQAPFRAERAAFVA
jgi:hypothetical protein